MSRVLYIPDMFSSHLVPLITEASNTMNPLRADTQTSVLKTPRPSTSLSLDRLSQIQAELTPSTHSYNYARIITHRFKTHTQTYIGLNFLMLVLLTCPPVAVKHKLRLKPNIYHANNPLSVNGEHRVSCYLACLCEW